VKETLSFHYFFMANFLCKDCETVGKFKRPMMFYIYLIIALSSLGYSIVLSNTFTDKWERADSIEVQYDNEKERAMFEKMAQKKKSEETREV
jgi:hypothetical protein